MTNSWPASCPINFGPGDQHSPRSILPEAFFQPHRLKTHDRDSKTSVIRALSYTTVKQPLLSPPPSEWRANYATPCEPSNSALGRAGIRNPDLLKLQLHNLLRHRGSSLWTVLLNSNFYLFFLHTELITLQGPILYFLNLTSFHSYSSLHTFVPRVHSLVPRKPQCTCCGAKKSS